MTTALVISVCLVIVLAAVVFKIRGSKAKRNRTKYARHSNHSTRADENKRFRDYFRS